MKFTCFLFSKICHFYDPKCISGTVRASHDIHRLNSNYVIFVSISTGVDRQYNMEM